MLQCAIGYEGIDCTIPIRTPSEPETPPDPFWKIVLYLAGVTVAAPCCCAFTITVWRKCSLPLVQVAPEEQKKDARLFMPREAKVADAKGVDVLDMTVLQPIAPAGVLPHFCTYSVMLLDVLVKCAAPALGSRLARRCLFLTRLLPSHRTAQVESQSAVTKLAAWMMRKEFSSASSVKGSTLASIARLGLSLTSDFLRNT